MSPTKERPILFKGEMVRAILDGSKTQTRRIVKHQRDMEFDVNDPAFGPYWLSYATEAEGEDAKVLCPYGKPGQLLWVRETWSVSSVHDYLSPKDIPSSARVDYAADGSSGYIFGKGRPSIFMPRWASRILLEIAAVRVERLQGISEKDAMAEGCPPTNPDPFILGHGGSSASGWYSELWESINGPGSWAANPFVWVVEFKRVQP